MALLKVGHTSTYWFLMAFSIRRAVLPELVFNGMFIFLICVSFLLFSCYYVRPTSGETMIPSAVKAETDIFNEDERGPNQL
jgi:hypothetical protein